MIPIALGLGLVGAVGAQYFPSTPEGVTTLKSKFHEGVTISYKEVGFGKLRENGSDGDWVLLNEAVTTPLSRA